MKLPKKLQLNAARLFICAEQVDNPECVMKKVVNEQSEFASKYDEALLHGIVELESDSLTLILITPGATVDLVKLKIGLKRLLPASPERRSKK